MIIVMTIMMKYDDDNDMEKSFVISSLFVLDFFPYFLWFLPGTFGCLPENVQLSLLRFHPDFFPLKILRFLFIKIEEAETGDGSDSESGFFSPFYLTNSTESWDIQAGDGPDSECGSVFEEQQRCLICGHLHLLSFLS